MPETAARDNSELASDVKVGGPVCFSVGSIRSSSPIFKIAVTTGDPDAEEQELLAVLHRPDPSVAQEYLENVLRAGGRYVQIHDPERFIVTFVPGKG